VVGRPSANQLSQPRRLHYELYLCITNLLPRAGREIFSLTIFMQNFVGQRFLIVPGTEQYKKYFFPPPVLRYPPHTHITVFSNISETHIRI